MPDCELALPDPGVVSEWNNSANPHTLPRPLCCQKTSPAGASQSVEQYKKDKIKQTAYSKGDANKVYANRVNSDLVIEESYHV